MTQDPAWRARKTTEKPQGGEEKFKEKKGHGLAGPQGQQRGNCLSPTTPRGRSGLTLTESSDQGVRASDGLVAMDDLAMSEADANRNGVHVRPGVDGEEFINVVSGRVKGVGCVQETQTPAGGAVIGRAWVRPRDGGLGSSEGLDSSGGAWGGRGVEGQHPSCPSAFSLEPSTLC